MEGLEPMKSPKFWAHLLGIVTLLAVFSSTAVAQSHPRLAGGKYPVKVDSAPPGATVYIDRKELGPVGVTPWTAKLAKGDYTIILELDGYQPAQKAIKVARTRKLQEQFIPLIKKLDPPRIDVRADADKNIFGATVWMDGQNQGSAPVLLTTDSGRHLVEIKKDGFETFSTWVDA